MSIFEDSTCSRCRQAGEKLFLKGEKCISPKCPFVRRSYGPGQHGQSRRKKPSDFSMQLEEKQRTKIMYGLNEEQFRRYYEIAEHEKVSLLSLLECRIDNVLYRLGFARSRVEARKLTISKHIKVTEWLQKDEWVGSVHPLPSVESFDSNINEQLIVEFYSR